MAGSVRIRSSEASRRVHQSTTRSGRRVSRSCRQRAFHQGGLQDADATIRTALVKRFLLWISRPDHLPAEWVVIRNMLNTNLLVKHHWPLSKWSNSFCEYINTHSTIWCDLVVVSAP